MHTVVNVHQHLLKSDHSFSRMQQKNEVLSVMMRQTHADLNLQHCFLFSSLTECFPAAVIFQTVITSL